MTQVPIQPGLKGFDGIMCSCVDKYLFSFKWSSIMPTVYVQLVVS